MEQLANISIDTIKKRHKRLYITLRDLYSAEKFADYILKKGLHHYPWERRGSVNTIQASFTCSLIVTYSRPFTRSRGLPALKPLGNLYNKTEAELHRKVIKLRHKVYAHSDSDSYKVEPFDIGGSIVTLERLPFFRLSKPDVSRLNRMIRKLIKHIKPCEYRVAKKIIAP